MATAQQSLFRLGNNVMNTPEISVIVCTHNRADMLRDALESLAKLETGGRFRFEIVVVDNASTDATAEVVQNVRRETQAPIHYVFEAKKGIATARNRGLREAGGQWIAFFDDDQLADPRWLQELFAYASDYNLLVVGGAVYLKLPDGCTRELHPFVRMLLGESQWSNEPFPYSPKVSPGTGNLMLHRSVFERVGTFDETFAIRAEDTDLYCRIWRANIEAWYVPAAIVHHVTPQDRLQPPYLNKLSAFMGDGIAQRERAARSRFTFLPRCLAKSALSPLVAAARLMSAQLCGQGENQLGLRCQLRLALAYAARGLALVRQDFGLRSPPVAWSLPQTATSADFAKRNA